MADYFDPAAIDDFVNKSLSGKSTNAPAPAKLHGRQLAGLDPSEHRVGRHRHLGSHLGGGQKLQRAAGKLRLGSGHAGITPA